MRKLTTLLLGLTVLACTNNENRIGERVEALPEEAWADAQWISAADAPVVTGKVRSSENCRAADGASWFRLQQTNPARVASARWMTTALGVYELYVNGKPVGDEFLKPGFTHYAKTKYSFTYDITAAFMQRKGAVNVLSAQVTPGWWADKVVTPSGNDGMVGKKPAFRAVLELIYTNGEKEYIGTDTLRWEAGVAGPVTHAAIYDGEEYDARLQPGCNQETELGTPEINREFAGEILPSSGAEVYLREDLTLHPVETYVWEGVEGADSLFYGKVILKRDYPKGRDIILEPGETLVVDFGQNASAVPSFLFKADEGTILTCLPAELLNDGNGAYERGMDGPEGSVHRTNLRTPEEGMRLVYTFGPGGKWTAYHPHFSFFGYRYISVSATGRVQIRRVESIPVTSITEESGILETGFEPINRLIANAVWGQYSNYLSVPTDCPQRNERAGWTADTQVFTQTGAFFANTASFFHKWMRDMRDTQVESGSFLAVAPPAGLGRNPMRFGWSDAGVIVPWTIWKQFADTAIIAENWEAMGRYMAHVAETRYDFALVAPETGNQQYADWLSYEPLETSGRGAFIPGVSPRTPLPEAVEYWSYLGACYWALDADMMREMADAIGENSEPWAQMADEARAYLKERFFTGEGQFKVEILNTMQTPALFALKTGLVDGEARLKMAENLRQNFAEHGNCLQTGFLGTSILLQTLTENGMADIAWELVFQRQCPSWLYSVDNGATTIWERWNSYTLENGMGPKGMNSFNHYAYGCVCQWLWETAAGIAGDSAEPGFKHILMRPVPDKRLDHINAEYRSVSGLIKSEWHYEGDTWVWTFTIPEGSTASVTVPGEDEKAYSAGTYEIRR